MAMAVCSRWTALLMCIRVDKMHGLRVRTKKFTLLNDNRHYEKI